MTLNLQLSQVIVGAPSSCGSKKLSLATLSKHRLLFTELD